MYRRPTRRHALATLCGGLAGAVAGCRSLGGVQRGERLAPADGEPGDAFGWDVALDEQWAMVGAPAADGGAGAAYLFDIGGSAQQRLAPGGSVALAEDRALLGSFLADGPATDAGSASVFERSEEAWDEQATLTAPDAAAGDRFGNAVALAGERALVGAVDRGGGPDAAADSGGACVFERGGGEWTHETTLPAPAEDPDAGFGVAVALRGDRALVGAFSANGTGPGRALLFERSGEWTRRTTLRPDNGESGDGFGSSVALADGRALVGAVGDSPGSATLFSL